MLLVLDNCEHVIEAAAALAVDTLRGAPSVRVLATSRELLRTEGEHVHRLSPLESPPTARQLSAAEALSRNDFRQAMLSPSVSGRPGCATWA
jgi:predicted ATPase